MILSTKELVKAYRRRRVVDGVSLEVHRGEVVGLLGPNGAGKTTTFYMIVGLVTPMSGNIFYNDENITKLPMYIRSRRGIGYLAQDASIFRKLTVEENILLILEELGKPPKERREIVEKLLDEFKIEHLRNEYGGVLSGGERRRVEIARALSTEPAFLLLDEPFTGVDPIAVQDIQEMVEYLKEKGIGILITDHNVRDTLKITDRSYIMHQGKILISGTSEEVATSEVAKKFYLGERFVL